MIKITINKYVLVEFLEKTCKKFRIDKLISSFHYFRVLIYLSGLIALNNPTATNMSNHFRCISHDKLTRTLDGFSWINLQFLVKHIQSIQSKTAESGHLIIDDVIMKKPYAFLIPGLWWVWDNSSKRSIMGLHIVVISWTNGTTKIPLCYKIWEPKIFAKKNIRPRLSLPLS